MNNITYTMTMTGDIDKIMEIFQKALDAGLDATIRSEPMPR